MSTEPKMSDGLDVLMEGLFDTKIIGNMRQRKEDDHTILQAMVEGGDTCMNSIANVSYMIDVEKTLFKKQIFDLLDEANGEIPIPQRVHQYAVEMNNELNKFMLLTLKRTKECTAIFSNKEFNLDDVGGVSGLTEDLYNDFQEVLKKEAELFPEEPKEGEKCVVLDRKTVNMINKQTMAGTKAILDSLTALQNAYVSKVGKSGGYTILSTGMIDRMAQFRGTLFKCAGDGCTLLHTVNNRLFRFMLMCYQGNRASNPRRSKIHILDKEGHIEIVDV